MEIEFIDFMGSIHVGVAFFCTEKNAFLPYNASESLIMQVQNVLEVDIAKVSDNIIGTLVIGNSNGCIVSNVLSLEVLDQLKSSGLPVYQSPEFFAFGNVALVNDHAGIISPIVPLAIRNEIADILDINLETRTLANSDLVGSLAYVTNYGGLFTPLASEEEVSEFKEILHLQEVGVGSVNKGSEFVASGIVGNTKGILVGRETTGIELMEITRSFSQ